MLHVVLFRPEIPPNTGNIGRTCAYAGMRLHLVHPLGFSLADRWLRRSGMDYWRHLDLREHADWPAFSRAADGPRRLWLMSRFGQRGLWQAAFAEGDGLLFGSESAGLPPWLWEAVGRERSLRLPGGRGPLRSLNLATAVGIASYEALRQLDAGAG